MMVDEDHIVGDDFTHQGRPKAKAKPMNKKDKEEWKKICEETMDSDLDVEEASLKLVKESRSLLD